MTDYEAMYEVTVPSAFVTSMAKANAFRRSRS